MANSTGPAVIKANNNLYSFFVVDSGATESGAALPPNRCGTSDVMAGRCPSPSPSVLPGRIHARRVHRFIAGASESEETGCVTTDTTCLPDREEARIDIPLGGPVEQQTLYGNVSLAAATFNDVGERVLLAWSHHGNATTDGFACEPGRERYTGSADEIACRRLWSSAHVRIAMASTLDTSGFSTGLAFDLSFPAREDPAVSSVATVGWNPASGEADRVFVVVRQAVGDHLWYSVCGATSCSELRQLYVGAEWQSSLTAIALAKENRRSHRVALITGQRHTPTDSNPSATLITFMPDGSVRDLGTRLFSFWTSASNLSLPSVLWDSAMSAAFTLDDRLVFSCERQRAGNQMTLQSGVSRTLDSLSTRPPRIVGAYVPDYEYSRATVRTDVGVIDTPSSGRVMGLIFDDRSGLDLWGSRPSSAFDHVQNRVRGFAIQQGENGLDENFYLTVDGSPDQAHYDLDDQATLAWSVCRSAGYATSGRLGPDLISPLSCPSAMAWGRSNASLLNALGMRWSCDLFSPVLCTDNPEVLMSSTTGLVSLPNFIGISYPEMTPPETPNLPSWRPDEACSIDAPEGPYVRTQDSQ